jgi:PPOX class probable F420-dependent enzyme
MLSEKVRERLEAEPVIWFTTVRADGQPQTSVVWFLLDENDEILVYSKRGTIRNRNVPSHHLVALNLDGNGRGGDVVTLEGTARVDSDALPVPDNSAYLEKYSGFIERNNWTPESFNEDYPVPIRVSIDRVRAW